LTGLRARRRPAGYWESDEALSRELTAFVLAGSWVQLPSETGEPYFYNAVGRFLHLVDLYPVLSWDGVGWGRVGLV